MISIGHKRRDVDIIHCIVFQEQAVIPLCKCIPHHHFDNFFRAVKVSFVITAVGATHHIVIDEYRAYGTVGAWDTDSDYGLAINFYSLYV